MVSKKIENLSDEDLHYLDKLLYKEFKRQCEYTSTFKSKNQYSYEDDTSRISKLRSAVQSQIKRNNMEKW